MKKLDVFKSEGGFRVCEGLWGENPIMDQCPWFASEDEAKNYISEKYGTLYTCDRDGNNAEPLNPDDEPYTRDDVTGLELGADCACYIREATIEDNCAADYVACDYDDAIIGYFIFKPVKI